MIHLNINALLCNIDKYKRSLFFVCADTIPNEIMVTIDIFSIPHLDEKLEVGTYNKIGKFFKAKTVKCF